MAAGRRKRPGIGVRTDAGPGRLPVSRVHVPRVGRTRNAHERPLRKAGTVLAVAWFSLVSLVSAFLLVVLVVGFFTPDTMDSETVVAFLVCLVLSLMVWTPAYLLVRRRLRRHRPVRAEVPSIVGSRRTAGASTTWPRSVAARVIAPQLVGSQLVDSPVGSRSPDRSRATAGRLESMTDNPLNELERAEQSLGDTLYQLDLSRGRRRLSREQITALRITGLRASSWLNGQADQVAAVRFGAGLAVGRLSDGVARYAEFAREAADFLTGRVGTRELDGARHRLVQLIEQPIQPPSTPDRRLTRYA
jgi:hypothetical protein